MNQKKSVLRLLVLLLVIGGIVWGVSNNANKETTNQLASEVINNSSESVATPPSSKPAQSTSGDFDQSQELKTFSSQSLGLSFDYPASWGDTKDDYIDEEYAFVRFENNKNVYFGGNSTFYVTGQRAKALTDCPGAEILGDRTTFQQRCQWVTSDADGNPAELINQTSEISGYGQTYLADPDNGRIVVSKDYQDVGFYEQHSIARIRPYESKFQGINLIMLNPNPEDNLLFDELVSSIKVLPESVE